MEYIRPQIEIYELEVELLTLSEDSPSAICNFKRGIMKKIKEFIKETQSVLYAIFVVLAVWTVEQICPNSILYDK